MNLHTIAAMMRAELGRLGYYRTVEACVSEIMCQCGSRPGRPR